jgi:hypothetical protein
VRLTELEPQFLRYEKRTCEPNVWIDGVRSANPYREFFHHVDTLAGADGISFLCPLCVQRDRHSVLCWFEGKVPDDVQPNPGRWNPIGTGYGDLSFVPGRKSHSVLLLGGCAWHGYITNGEVSII